MVNLWETVLIAKCCLSKQDGEIGFGDCFVCLNSVFSKVRLILATNSSTLLFSFSGDFSKNLALLLAATAHLQGSLSQSAQSGQGSNTHPGFTLKMLYAVDSEDAAALIRRLGEQARQQNLVWMPDSWANRQWLTADMSLVSRGKCTENYHVKMVKFTRRVPRYSCTGIGRFSSRNQAKITLFAFALHKGKVRYKFEHTKEVLSFVELVMSNISPTGFVRDRKSDEASRRHAGHYQILTYKDTPILSTCSKKKLRGRTKLWRKIIGPPYVLRLFSKKKNERCFPCNSYHGTDGYVWLMFLW